MESNSEEMLRKLVEEAEAKYDAKIKVKRFKRNELGRDFVVGDIHGCFTLVREKLDALSFDPLKDRLFSVGDLVDRGAESAEALDWLAYDWFHSVLGNHELMAIQNTGTGNEAYMHERNGGLWFNQLNERERQQFREAFDELPVVIEVETNEGLVGIIHAHCPYNKWHEIINYANNRGERGRHELVWNRERVEYGDNTTVEGVLKVYHGHTPLRTRATLGNRHYIDLGACFNGKLIVEEI